MSFAPANRQSPKAGALGDAQRQKQSDIKKPVRESPGRGLVLSFRMWRIA